MFLWIFVAALIFVTIESLGTPTHHTTRIWTWTVCINVVTNGDTEALCPIDGPIKWPTSFLETLDDIRKTPLPRKQWVEVTTPLAQEVGSAEIQAYFPISVFNHRYTIPKMVTTLEFPAGETDVYFNPAGAGCLTDKEGSGWKIPELQNCWSQKKDNDRVKSNPYYVVGYTPPNPTDTDAHYANQSPGGYLLATDPPSDSSDSSSTEPLAVDSDQVTDGGDPGASTAEPADSDTTSGTPPVTGADNVFSVGRRRLPRFYI